MEVYKSSSNLKPVTWQKETDFIYHNFNVVEEEKETEEGKEVVFNYDVEKYTKEEYFTMLEENNSKSIDDILVMLLEG